jgi:hypothetical protein
VQKFLILYICPITRQTMKLCIFFTLFLILSGMIVRGGPRLQSFDKANFQPFDKARFQPFDKARFQPFDKARYYAVLASAGVDAIDAELSVLESASIKDNDAFEGALLMKKAGLLKRPKDKLATFKSGYRKLESAMAKDSSNIEYHFLRLVIQEHAPKVVHYNKDQESDSQAIIRSFKSLSPVVQQAILDYCKHSNILHAKELNG